MVDVAEQEGWGGDVNVPDGFIHTQVKTWLINLAASKRLLKKHRFPRGFEKYMKKISHGC